MELMEQSDLLKLAKAASHKTALSFSANGKEQSFSADTVDNVLREQLNLLAGDYNSFRRNQVRVFELIEQSLDEILPRKVEEQYSQFAEVKSIGNSDRAVFKLKVTEAARKRAKSFVTRVGLAGRYETMKLDGKELTVTTSAIGYALRVEFEEVLDGRWTFADFTDIMAEGMNKFIYEEIHKALVAAVAQLPAVNKASVGGFDEAVMDELLAISDSYGNGPATLYCTREFASKMLPQDKFFSDSMKDTLWRQGMLGDYKGHNVVILEQSMADETNTEKAIDPQWCYIFSTVDRKPVKVVFQGDTHVRTTAENDDWSTEMHTYKKFGVAVFTNPSICAYQNTELKKATR